MFGGAMRGSLLRWFCVGLLFLRPGGAHDPHDVVAAVTASEDGSTVFVVSNGQLLRSDDGGLSWELVMKDTFCSTSSRNDVSCGAPEEQFLFASPSYSSDQTVFWGSTKYGLRRSVDGGYNWKPVGNNLFNHCTGKGHFTLSNKFGVDDNLMLVVGENIDSEGTFNLFRSTDAGNTFEVVDLSSVYGRSNLQTCAALYSLSEDVHFLGTDAGFFVSDDGGVAWNEVMRVPGSQYQEGSEIVKITGALGVYEGEDEYDLFIMTPENVQRVRVRDTVTGTHFLTEVVLEPKEGMGFLNMVAHRGEEGSENLFAMQEGCASDVSCSRTMFVSEDGGENWSEAHGEELTGVVWDGHVSLATGELHSTSFDAEQFNDAWGVPETGVVFLGTFEGVFRSDDYGSTWIWLDTLSYWITSLSVGPLEGGKEGFLLDFSTYDGGSFGGVVTRSNDDQFDTSGIHPLPLADPSLAVHTFEMIAVSPKYDEDSMTLRSTKRGLHNAVLERSYDNFNMSSEFIYIDALDEAVKPAVHTIVYSPNYREDNTLFVAGHNLGLTMSVDGADTFELLFDPRDYGSAGSVTTVALSPKFGTDGAMAILVDTYETSHISNGDYESEVFLSRDRGSTWEKITDEPQDWMNLVAIKEGDYPVFVAVHQDQGMYFYTGSTTVWQEIDQDKQMFLTDGYGNNGVVASPTGEELVAAFKMGGNAHFAGFDASQKTFTTEEVSPSRSNRKFYFERRQNGNDGIGSAIAFSPYYDEDSIVFAASYYSIFASFDKGVSWKEIFHISQSDMGTINFGAEDDESLVVKVTLSSGGMIAFTVIFAFLLLCVIVLVLRGLKRRRSMISEPAGGYSDAREWVDSELSVPNDEDGQDIYRPSNPPPSGIFKKAQTTTV